uniref:Glutathione transferase n=1 Tax=Palpitomonas bilix TaxID=652834 RepID=A0A7S3GLT2_9EUKA
MEVNSTVVIYTAGKITPEFGYVALVGVIMFFVHNVFTLKVAMARKKYGILPPRMIDSETPDEYNRVQRVHLNNTENLPSFFFFLLASGIGFPIPAAVSGLVYVLGRIFGAIGYYKAAKKRSWGSFFHVGEFALVVLTAVFAFFLILDKPAY